MVVLWNLPFSFYATLLSREMPEAWSHFIYSALIRWFTSLSISHPFAALIPNIESYPSKALLAHQS
jgi:hypothetical protein